MSRDVVFDGSALWLPYLPSLPTPIHSIPNSEDEACEAELPPRDEEIGALGESPISFRLRGLNEGLSQDGQPIEEPASSGDSVVLSPQGTEETVYA